MVLENLKKGDIVHIGSYTFIFLWFYGTGIDLQAYGSIQIFNIKMRDWHKIQSGPAENRC